MPKRTPVSVYKIECANCGAPLVSTVREFTCTKCGCQIVLEWPAK